MRCSMLSLLVLLVLAFPAAAAESSTLYGVVRDDVGQSLPGVTITVQSVTLDSARIAVTSADGQYVLKSLPAGLYSLEAVMEGFDTQTHSFSLSVGQKTELDLVLKIDPIDSGIIVNN